MLSAEQPRPDDRLFVRRAEVPALAGCSEWPSQGGDTVSAWTEENSAPADPHWGFPFPVAPGTIVVQRNGRGERLFLALVALCPVTCTPFMQDSART